MRARVPVMALTAAASAGVAIFFTLYSLIPVTRGEEAGLSSLFAGTMMVFVMGVQVFTPALVRRFSLRGVLIASLLVLAAGALLTGIASGTAALLAGAVASGSGFGVLIVAGAQGVALLVPPGRLGRALGTYGLVTMASSALGSPAGLHIALTFSSQVFGVCAVAAGLIAAVASLGVPPGVGKAGTSTPASASGPRGVPALVSGAPWLVLAVLLVAVVLLSHGLSSLPVLAAAHGSAAVTVFAVQVGNALGRGIGGELEARITTRATLIAGVLLLAAGGALGVATGGQGAVITAGALIGLGVGIVQTVTLHTAMRRMDSGRASVVWNLAVDGGLWAGGVLWGIAIASGFVVAGALVLSVLLLGITAVAVLRLPGHGDR
ncbi:MFS transporter [Sediminivirga luteola]|uniref:MFS transporter n=1 Tax=Sediminivirga luteola TaxID=1774748 RepID=A0A8J2TWE0_9MICO|nr:MFS transporter [Sediminivirga luteola]MCI2266570.1 MFS transporter [Sediminivirga luteola]GGA07969.1 MFS transporter [Sediminivirga luteola]